MAGPCLGCRQAESSRRWQGLLDRWSICNLRCFLCHIHAFCQPWLFLKRFRLTCSQEADADFEKGLTMGNDFAKGFFAGDGLATPNTSCFSSVILTGSGHLEPKKTESDDSDAFQWASQGWEIIHHLTELLWKHWRWHGGTFASFASIAHRCQHARGLPRTFAVKLIPVQLHQLTLAFSGASMKVLCTKKGTGYRMTTGY